MVEKRFEKLGMPDIERFENYLPTAFNSELTLLQKVNKIIFDLIETNKLTNEMVDYLNRFIETFDEKLYETLEDVLNVWLEDGRLADVVRVAINDEVIEARTDYLGKKYVNLKERLDSEKAESLSKTNEIEADIAEVTTQLSQKASQTDLEHIAVNVKAYGAIGKGNVSEDDSLAIQKALDTGRTVIIPKGVYYVDGGRITILNPGSPLTTALLPKSNQTIIFEQGAVIKVIPNNLIRYGVFGIQEKENVSIINGTLIGERNEHLGTVGEWGHGVVITSSKNITLENMNTSDFWGDGFVVGTINQNDSTKRSENVQLLNCEANNNRRQGLSVTGVKGLRVFGGKYNNTNGTQPEAGIDFEPDGISTKNEDCVLENVESTNNRFGFMFTQNENIILRDCKTADNLIGSLYITAGNKLLIDNLTTKNETVLHLGSNITENKEVTIKNSLFNLAPDLAMITATSGNPFVGFIDFLKNVIKLPENKPKTINIPESADKVTSEWSENEIVIPPNINNTLFTGTNILVYGNNNLKFSKNTINNKSSVPLRLFSNVTSNKYGEPNKYIGAIENSPNINGDSKILMGIGDVASGTSKGWENISVLSAKVGDKVIVTPLFENKKTILTGNIYPDGKLNLYAYNPDTESVYINSNVQVDIQSS